MFQIKIRGIASLSDALFAAEAGVDCIGLCFDERNPRCLDAGLASEIVSAVRDVYSPADVEIYAEFVDAAVDDILWILRDAELYGPEQGVGIELGGAAPPSLVAELQEHGLGPPQGLLHALGHAPIVPITVAFAQEASCAQIEAYLADCQRLKVLPDALLVTGTQHGDIRGLPLILGGGLTSHNVAESIAITRPAAVDVGPGVESAPGKLDAARVWEFVAAAKPAFARLPIAPPRRV